MKFWIIRKEIVFHIAAGASERAQPAGRQVVYPGAGLGGRGVYFCRLEATRAGFGLTSSIAKPTHG